MPPLPVLVIALTPPPSGVELLDALQFQVTREIAQCNEQACELHTQKVVKKFDDWARWAWEYRQDNVLCAWRDLRIALSDEVLTDTRLKSLDRLRRQLGDEAYFAGWMPSPIPDYGPWAPWKQ